MLQACEAEGAGGLVKVRDAHDGRWRTSPPSPRRALSPLKAPGKRKDGRLTRVLLIKRPRWAM